MLHLTRNSLTAAIIGSIVFSAIATIVWQPALAREVVQTLAGITNCSSNLPCSGWNNTGSGTAVQGTASATDGVKGVSTGAGKSGVYGETDATTGGFGLHGANASTNGFGVYGLGRSGVGIWANATGVKPSLLANALGGDAADLFSSTGNGAIIANGATSANGIAGLITNYKVGIAGAIIGGIRTGLVAVSNTEAAGEPLSVWAVNNAGYASGFFNVDTKGDLDFSGSIIGTTVTRSGARVTSYSAKTTQSNVEDTGTAQLVDGVAVVRLDSAYAESIDLQTPYRVFLTADADSRGLYVARKSATAFIVREMQGGRGTFSFDYRIVGAAVGRTADRMAEVSPEREAQLFHLRR